MLMVRLWGSLRVKTKTGRREDENWTAPSSLLQDSMFLSQELLTDFSIRVIAAGGPHQQGTREGDDDDAKHCHRGNGLAQYRRGDDHAHGGVDGEQRADHARRRDAPGQHSLCTTNDNVQCKRIAVKHLHDAAERYSTKAKQRHR